jgi:hypothetical protein
VAHNPDDASVWARQGFFTAAKREITPNQHDVEQENFCPGKVFWKNLAWGPGGSRADTLSAIDLMGLDPKPFVECIAQTDALAR